MKNCCENKSSALDQLRQSQLGILKTVLVINAVMFLVECAAGIMANSTSLIADSMDMLGDASVYAFSIYVVGRSLPWKARAARFKAYIMVAFGFAVLAEALRKSFSDVVPEANIMSGIGVLALIANLMCLYLLYRHRRDDVNMRSTWICSRNDIIANTSVLGAAFLVYYSGSSIPDVVVGSAIATLFIASAVGILNDARNAVLHET